MDGSSAFERARDAFVAGVAAHDAGRLEEAESRLQESLRWLPGRPSTLSNLGIVLLKLGRAADAAPLLEQAANAQPGQADLLFHWGCALLEAGNPAAALARLDAALAIDAQPAAPWLFRGQCLMQLSRLNEAAEALEQALRRDETHGLAARLHGDALRALGRSEAAAQAYRQALALGHDVETTRFLLAAAEGDTLAAPPRSYVERLFDDYADSFDAHLVAQLGYDAPNHLVRIVERVMSERPLGAALDLGCGTGLAIGALRAIAQAVDGVDLSERMIALARARGGYRHLAHATALDFLAASGRARYDLVLAADVLIYIGAVEPLFAAVHGALTGDGAFAFTVERAADDGPGLVLHEQARYAHSAAYIESSAAAAGFEVLALESHALRRDQDGQVPGLYVVLGRR